MRATTIECDKPNCTEKISLGIYYGGIFWKKRVSHWSKEILRSNWKVVLGLGWGVVDDGNGHESLDYCPSHYRRYQEEVYEANESYTPEVR